MELTQCTKGGYFGELALVTHKPRAASVYAVGDLVCAGRIGEYLGNFFCWLQILDFWVILNAHERCTTLTPELAKVGGQVRSTHWHVTSIWLHMTSSEGFGKLIWTSLIGKGLVSTIITFFQPRQLRYTVVKGEM